MHVPIGQALARSSYPRQNDKIEFIFAWAQDRVAKTQTSELKSSCEEVF